MINNRRITPIGLSESYEAPEIHIPSAKELTALLADKGVAVTMGESLKGGTVSQVYAGSEQGRAVVVKYTTDSFDTDPTVSPLPHQSHYTDSTILKYLAKTNGVRVPQVLHDFQDQPITVMEDMRAAGFTILNENLLNGHLPMESASEVGKGIAVLQQTLAKHEEFETALSGPQVYYERGLELRLAYPNTQTQYDRLEKRFTNAHQQLIAVDTHPKNMFVNKEGKVAWIDFGFSVWGDRDFALPNCMAHIFIYALAGYIERPKAATFVTDAVAAYRNVLPIEDANIRPWHYLYRATYRFTCSLIIVSSILCNTSRQRCCPADILLTLGIL